jgi:2-amino-4-hydroxy-6-hydroxymethyldihydropteridine diphosphokinase
VDRVTAAIALGSNLGDRQAHLDYAISRIRELFSGLQVSPYYETVPVAVPAPQPMFLNAAAVGETTLAPRELLESLLAIEAARGRERPHPNAARSLDLDLILYGDLVLATEELIVPHPRFRERQFVLEPLASIAADFRDPVSGQTVGELWAAVRRRDRA